MKTWKLVSGIICIVLALFVLFQSCAAGLSNALQDNGEVSGSAGLIVAIMLLAGGIVSIATRNGGKGGNIALIVMFGIAALVGFTLAGSYRDLLIWATWCLICATLAVVDLVKIIKASSNPGAEIKPTPKSVPKSQPQPVARKPFPLKSKDLVKAEGMVTYCEWFHFESGASKELCKRLFEKTESSVSPDKEVVMTFMALGDYKSQMENGGPCACVMSATKFIVASDREVITIPITDIDGFSVVSGSPMSVITMSHRYGELKLGVENSTLPLLLNFCNEALADCKKEIEELSAK